MNTAAPPRPDAPVRTSNGPSAISVKPSGAFRAASPLNEWTADNRMLTLAADAPIKVRPLPLPMLYQDRLGPGHDGARLGLSKVDRIWREGDTVIMEGTFDMEDPDAAELARKVAQGYVRFLSLDVDMATAQEVCVRQGTVLEQCDPEDPTLERGTVYSDWRAMGATLLAHPAYPEAIMVSLAASAAWPQAPGRPAAAVPLQDDTAPPTDAEGYDPAWGCVAPDPAAETGWSPAACDAEGAVQANPTGDGPFTPADGEAVAEEMPTEADLEDAMEGEPTGEEADDDLPANPTPAQVDEADTVDDAEGGCVAPDPDNEGGWVPADCDAPGAVPANPDQTAPADAVTDATNQAALTTQLAVSADTPWADRSRAWDGAAAADRVEAWATPEGADTFQPDRMNRAFLVVDGPPDLKGSYKFGVADIVDGELRLVWNGVVAANAALSGARTPTTIPADDRRAAQNKIAELYRSAARAFDDPTILEGTGAEGASLATDTPNAPNEERCECERDGTWQPCDCTDEGARRMATIPDDCEPCRAAVITAAAPEALAPPGWTPPHDWFNPPAAPEALAIQIHPETGRIAGYLAAWNTCHVGYPGRCITPPHSATDYSYFNVRPIPTDHGYVYCGLITMDTGHATLRANATAALAHYDNTGTQAAVIRVGEDAHGIWAAGAVLPFITPEQRQRLALASFSGDWREIRGNAELIAALAVNVPGFPLPASRTGADNQPYSLVAAGALTPTRPTPNPDSSATANIHLDAGHVAALVIAELDARQERTRRHTAATTTLNHLRHTEATRRINLARARVLRPVGAFPQPGRLRKEDVDFAENWVDQQGGLPAYIKRIADHLKGQPGWTTGRAIATAVNVVKKMCATGDTNWPGLQQVNATSRSQACAAAARWEAMKAAARAD